MLRKIGISLVVVVIFVAMILFTRINPGTVTVDLAFGVVEPGIPMAFAVTFIAGWLFGLLCTVLFITRLLNDRRKLRKALTDRESEVSSLRNLPIADAD